jgi:hypothetical protein
VADLEFSQGGFQGGGPGIESHCPPPSQYFHTRKYRTDVRPKTAGAATARQAIPDELATASH